MVFLVFFVAFLVFKAFLLVFEVLLVFVDFTAFMVFVFTVFLVIVVSKVSIFFLVVVFKYFFFYNLMAYVHFFFDFVVVNLTNTIIIVHETFDSFYLSIFILFSLDMTKENKNTSFFLSHTFLVWEISINMWLTDKSFKCRMLFRLIRLIRIRISTSRST